MLGRSKAAQQLTVSRESSGGLEELKMKPEKWSMGVLNDRETEEVPGQSTADKSRVEQEFRLGWNAESCAHT